MNGWVLLLIALGCEIQSDPAGSPSSSQYRVASAVQLTGPWNNRLETAQSPYLRMHGQDPINWYAWGDEAFAAAKQRNVPIFLSIGYYACHWCHVMHRESFKNPTIAAFLNQHFVSVKVDREERPDVDTLYMDAVHILNRNNGGWPASIWMTPDGKPFFAGTYFPPESRSGRPGFLELLNRIQEDWSTKPSEIHGFADKTGKRLLKRAELQGGGTVPIGTASEASRRLVGSWSPTNRGWGTRRQFPMTPTLQFLLWHSVVDGNLAAGALVEGQLSAMDEGGLHDHLGGGFHRYAVDPLWMVPHFEKMLYDNGQLLATYAEAAIALEQPRFAQVAEDIGDYLIGQMEDPDGGFYSSQSADSEGEEGTFYVWKPSEVQKALGDATDFLTAYPVTQKGNFEGSRTVLNRQSGVDPESESLKEARQKLFEYRAMREHPPTDKKLVMAWNGLTIGALARAGRLLNQSRFTTAAQRAAERILRVVSDGKVPRLVAPESPLGVLEDYAFLGNGLLDLFEADGDPRWLQTADAIAASMVQRFRDSESGVLYQADKEVVLLARKAELTDGAEPSGYGRGLRLLARLRAYGSATVEPAVIDSALQQASWLLERAPNNAVSVVSVAERMAVRSTEVVIATPSMDHPSLKAMMDVYNEKVRPTTVLAIVTPDTAKTLASFTAILGKEPGDGVAQAFLCHDGICHLPTADASVFKNQLAQQRTP